MSLKEMVPKKRELDKLQDLLMTVRETGDAYYLWLAAGTNTSDRVLSDTDMTRSKSFVSSLTGVASKFPSCITEDPTIKFDNLEALVQQWQAEASDVATAIVTKEIDVLEDAMKARGLLGLTYITDEDTSNKTPWHAAVPPEASVDILVKACVDKLKDLKALELADVKS